MSYSASKEVAARFAANQELSTVVNKVLQAHEREMKARMMVEMPRAHPAPPSIVARNRKALAHYADVRQAAVVELCDTIRDQVIATIASQLESALAAAVDRRTPPTFDRRTLA